MGANANNSQDPQYGAAGEEPFVVIGGKAYPRAPFTPASSEAEAAGKYVVIDNFAYPLGTTPAPVPPVVPENTGFLSVVSNAAEPFVVVDGKAYPRAPIASASSEAEAAGKYVVIDNFAYPLGTTATPVPMGTTFSSVAPNTAEQYVVIEGTAYPRAPINPAPAETAVPGPNNAAPAVGAAASAFPHGPTAFPPTVISAATGVPGPTDPMAAALDEVIRSAAAPTRQFPAPSWAAVALFALLLGAFVTFVLLGMEIAAVLGALALLGMIAAHIRRGLS